MHAGLNPELVGLTLVYVVSLAGQFQYCIRQSAEMENIVRSATPLVLY